MHYNSLCVFVIYGTRKGLAKMLMRIEEYASRSMSPGPRPAGGAGSESGILLWTLRHRAGGLRWTYSPPDPTVWKVVLYSVPVGSGHTWHMLFKLGVLVTRTSPRPASCGWPGPGLWARVRRLPRWTVVLSVAGSARRFRQRGPRRVPDCSQAATSICPRRSRCQPRR